jgi:hypothetical protein
MTSGFQRIDFPRTGNTETDKPETINQKPSIEIETDPQKPI